MFTHCPHEQISVDAIEKGPDIKIKHPGVPPAALTRHAYSFECRFARPVSLGVAVELRLHQRLQEPLDHRLGDAVGHRRYP